MFEMQVLVRRDACKAPWRRMIWRHGEMQFELPHGRGLIELLNSGERRWVIEQLAILPGRIPFERMPCWTGLSESSMDFSWSENFFARPTYAFNRRENWSSIRCLWQILGNLRCPKKWTSHHKWQACNCPIPPHLVSFGELAALTASNTRGSLLASFCNTFHPFRASMDVPLPFGSRRSLSLSRSKTFLELFSQLHRNTADRDAPGLTLALPAMIHVRKRW